MIEFYSEIRLVHVAAALTSGGIFLARGLVSLSAASHGLEVLLRYLGYVADTTLLTVALMLMTIVQRYPFAEGWLTVKLLLLVVYVTLGFVAFGAHRPPTTRYWRWVAGLATFGFIYSVALTRHPLGFLAT